MASTTATGSGAGGAGGSQTFHLVSDGKDMVWFEGSGEFTSTPEPYYGRYAETWLMASPHATEPAGVQPRKLRKALFDFVGGGYFSAIGGGYAVHLETKYGEQVGQVVVTRLSDGAYWVVPHRPKLYWGEPLYVDAEELALVEYASPEVAKEVGLYPGGWTIVRKKIASLGQPTGIGAQP